MQRIIKPAPQVKPHSTNFPERLSVVRAAHARPSGIYRRATAYVYTSKGARSILPNVGPRWRPGGTIPKRGESEVNALDALRRNADEAARRGIYAPDSGQDRKVA